MIGDARAILEPFYSFGLVIALGSDELTASSIEDAHGEDDVSAMLLGVFEPAVLKSVNTVRALIQAFYDFNFSFGEFISRFPAQRRGLIYCPVGDVLKDCQSSLSR